MAETLHPLAYYGRAVDDLVLHVMYGHAGEVDAELEARPRSAEELGTMLIHAVIPGRPDVARALLAHGAMLTSACIARAVELRRVTIVVDMLRAGARLTQAHVRIALGWNSGDVALALRGAADGPEGRKGLIVVAAGDNDAGCVGVLLDAEGEPPPDWLSAALATASTSPHSGATVRLLLERGASAAALDLRVTRSVEAFRAGLDAGASVSAGLLATCLQTPGADADEPRAWELVRRGVGVDDTDALTHARSKRIILELLRRGASGDPEACRRANNPTGADIVRCALERAKARRMVQARAILLTLLPLDIAELIVDHALADAAPRTRKLYRDIASGGMRWRSKRTSPPKTSA